MKTVCVYCGSSKGKNAIYANQAQALAEEFIKRGIKLIYGGGNLGLMAEVARSITDNGGKVVGIIPKALHAVSGDGYGETVVVDTMHERKSLMSDMSDAFISLPGGFGTLEELIETTTWSQLRIHNKPVGILNVNGYYDHLIKWMDHAVTEGFIDEQSRQLVLVADSPAALLDAMDQFKDPIDESKWILKKDSWSTKARLSSKEI
ncbi:hypothetical protein MP228_011179 [Amoeboaphelidium protococcarum]|nr:hypothetical protein MP228_011179 [Amoeboaphelidium protococcarum]